MEANQDPIVMKGFKLRGYHCIQDAAALSEVNYQVLQRIAKTKKYRGKTFSGFRKIAGRWWVHTMTLEAIKKMYIPGHDGIATGQKLMKARKKRKGPKPAGSNGTFVLTIDGVTTRPIRIGARVNTINKYIAEAKALAELKTQEEE